MRRKSRVRIRRRKPECYLVVLILLALLLLGWQLSASVILQRQHDTTSTNPIQSLTKSQKYEFVNRGESSLRRKKQLEFVHIPKTGGTAIENAAARAGMAWGVCHFEAQRQICHSVKPDLGWPRTFPLVSDLPLPKFSGEYWHTPPHWFVDNPFEGKDSFAVVRNPYDRYISEYYCQFYGHFQEQPQPLFKMDNAADRVARFELLQRQKHEFQQRKKAHRKLQSQQDSPEHLNAWLLHHLQNYQGRSGHMLPQRYFTHDNDGKQVVTHILKYESLQEEFVKLMKEYHLPVQYPKERMNQGQERWTRNDLTPRVIREINKFAKDDFDYFGYEMMDPSTTV